MTTTLSRAERKAPEALTRELATTRQFRAVSAGDALRTQVDDAERTVEIAWASEQPYERWYGDEILDCNASSIRLGRLRDGAALLFNHRMDALIGVVESVQIGVDRMCRAKVRFDTSADGELRFQQVRNGVLRQVSVGYIVHRMVLEEEADDKSTYRVCDWEPYELSMVTVAADPSVGVGRSADDATTGPSSAPRVHPTTISTQTKDIMDTTNHAIDTQPAAPSAAELEIKRRDRLIGLGVQFAKYVTTADVRKFCTEQKSVDEFQDYIMERMSTTHHDTRGAQIGMSAAEVRRYSIGRAVQAMCTGDWTGAGLERAATDAATRQFGLGATSGIYIPFDVVSTRDFNVGTAGEAGNLVATDLRPDLFVDVLRNQLVLGRMGITYLFGLSSNVDMPRKTATSALGFLAETAAAGKTQPNTGKVTLSPKRIGAFIEFSKQAVIQSSMAVEPLLRQDILDSFARQVEDAAINGSGAGVNPRGLRNTSGVGSVVGGTNGAQVAWSHVIGLETACAAVNSEPDASSGYLMNAKTRGWLKSTTKSQYQGFIWSDANAAATPVNGYRVGVSNTMPGTLVKGSSGAVCSSLIFGSNWPMLVVGTFGALELRYDDTTLAPNGLNRLVLNAFVDVGCRRAADFSIMDDALTA